MIHIVWDRGFMVKQQNHVDFDACLDKIKMEITNKKAVPYKLVEELLGYYEEVKEDPPEVKPVKEIFSRDELMKAFTIVYSRFKSGTKYYFEMKYKKGSILILSFPRVIDLDEGTDSSKKANDIQYSLHQMIYSIMRDVNTKDFKDRVDAIFYVFDKIDYYLFLTRKEVHYSNYMRRVLTGFIVHHMGFKMVEMDKPTNRNMYGAVSNIIERSSKGVDRMKAAKRELLKKLAAHFEYADPDPFCFHTDTNRRMFKTAIKSRAKLLQ